MNAIDTNILVRLIVKDNEIQSKKALNYIKKQKEVFISTVVFCEAIWVFKSCYNINKTELINIIENILFTAQFIHEYSDGIWIALNEYKRHNTDFTDCLIGAISKQHQCEKVATFDKKASKSSFFELVK